MIRTFPIPGFVSVVCLAVCGLLGDGVQLAPGLPLGQVHLALFLLGKRLLGNVFLHTDFLLIWFLKSVYHNPTQIHKRFVNPEITFSYKL